MADFYQTGVVTTLHRLGHAKVDQLERISSGSPWLSRWPWCCRA